MDRLRRQVPRREVIEQYVRYDLRKKHPDQPLPKFDDWNWSGADAIDDEMGKLRLKVGVPAGYELWDEVLITVNDLLGCAVDSAINESLGSQLRMLGDLEARGFLANWRPGSERPWHSSIATGKIPDNVGPLLLRRAVPAEFPASWYVEDGGGRATAFVKYRSLFDPTATLVVGYLGATVDMRSSFLRQHLPALFMYGNR